MLNCFKCQKYFKDVDEYMCHLKIFHFLTNSDSKTCVFNNCNSTFSRFSSLKRHLQQHTKIDSEPVQKLHKTLKSIDIEQTTKQNKIVSINVEQSSTIIESIDKATDINEHLINNDNEYEVLEKSLNFNILDFAVNLYSKNSISRKDAKDILNQYHNIWQSTFNNLQKYNLLSPEITNLLNIPFENYSSEFKFRQLLKKLDLFKESDTIVITNEIDEIVSKGNPTLGPKIKSVQVMPIEFQIKKFFELPNVFNSMKESQKLFKEKKHICNIVNGEVIQRYFNESNISFTYNLYFDDFQVNNPLGTHTYSLCGCYYSFPTLPQYLQSKLDFIFPAMFCSSDCFNKIGPETCLKPLVEVLKRLENGIVIGSTNVSFYLGLIIGDNLAVNTVLGLTQSFNSIRFCRYCREEKNNTRQGTFETNFRTLNNYNADVLENNIQTGVKTECIFNELSSFHLVENMSFDIMHDIFEGVCHYDISGILFSLINENVLSLNSLNNRKRLFPYGEFQISNRSPDITMNNIKNGRFKMTASEMLCFVTYLPLMIGDLIPSNNKHWRFLILLSKIIDLLMQNELSKENLEKLDQLIIEHHTLYLSLYGNLKPKHHFMTHYKRAILKCGPLKCMWAMRFESKHKDMKVYAHAITSRKNIEKTLSTKCSLKFSSILLKYKEGFPKIYNNCSFKLRDISTENIKCNEYDIDFKNILTTDCLTYKNIVLKKNCILCTKNDNKISLYKFNYCIKNKSRFFAVCNQLKVAEFCDHFFAYEILTIENSSFYVIDIELFLTKPTNIVFANNGKKYVRYQNL